MLVADSAEVLNGKVYTLGLGWNNIGTPTPPHALVVLFDVDWTETNKKMVWRAELVNSDMQPVTVQTDVGEQQVQIDGEMEVGRPPGLPHGSSVRVPFSATFGSLNLTPGTRYEWRVQIDGDSHQDWSESFTVRAQ